MTQPSNAASEVKPIFIVGLPRSGSTLWLNVFAEHPEICRIGETLFLTPWRKDLRTFLRRESAGLSDDRILERMLVRMLSGQYYPGLEASFWRNEAVRNADGLRIRLFRRLKNTDRSIAEIVRAVIEEYTLQSGKVRCCAKFPVYLNWVPQLRSWFPDCKIVHVTRDPRAMLVSRMNDPGGTELKIRRRPALARMIRGAMSTFVLLQFVWASYLHTKYRSFHNYQLFRFEDLVKNPADVIQELCQFCDLSFDTRMLNPQRGQPSSVTGKREAGFNSEAASHWKFKISPRKARLVRAILRPSMERLGYQSRT